MPAAASPSRYSAFDLACMRRALALARRGLGRVEPNPMVGAVVAQNDTVIGEGFHQRFGTAHAEVMALFPLGHNGKGKAKGSTIYVTLEPCCHWGKTPPCTNLILGAGVGRVVAAMVDPFAQVHGKGIQILRDAGVRVDVGLLEAEARALNAPFLTRLAQQRPFVIAKWAQSLDGRIATAAGESKWISSEESRAQVQQLRARVDGILVGIGTVLADDPLLTARVSAGRLRRLASRIVIDSTSRLPVESRLVKTIADAPVLLVHRQKLPAAAERRRRVLASRGVMTLAVGADRNGRVNLGALLKHLAAMDYTNLLVEGGAQTLGSFVDGDLVDEAHVFVAPMIIGGENAPHAVGGRDIRKLSDAKRLTLTSLRQSGPDIHAVLRRLDLP